MTDVSPQALFASKYHDQEKIWSGHSFLSYDDLKALLAELPVSSEPIPARSFRKRYCGNLEQVFGELFYNLAAFQGVLQDRAFHLEECYLVPFIRDNNYVLEFVINYKTKAGEEKSRAFDVLRLDQRHYCMFFDKFASGHPLL